MAQAAAIGERTHRCFAAETAIACERRAVHRVATGAGPRHACEQHLRLLERMTERGVRVPGAGPAAREERARVA